MYPNPYMMNMIPKSSLLTRSLSTLKSIKWSTLLEGTQKTLGVINQAIPIVYQVKPIVNNAKTIFKIANYTIIKVKIKKKSVLKFQKSKNKRRFKYTHCVWAVLFYLEKLQ